MTSQSPDILINEHSIELGDLKPFFIRNPDGHPDIDYGCFPVAPSFPEGNGFSSGLWRGSIATLRLCSDGRLELVRYEFPQAPNKPAFQSVNKFFESDFDVTFRKLFGGPNTTIPFRDGVIVADREHWDIDDQIISGVVSQVLRTNDTNKPHCLRITCLSSPFLEISLMPLSCIPEDVRGNPDALVGRSVDCTIERPQNPRGPFDFILAPIRFGDLVNHDTNN